MNAAKSTRFTILCGALLAVSACSKKESPTENASCSLVSSAFADVPASFSTGDTKTGRFTGTALSLLSGCTTRKAAYALSSVNPAIATVAMTIGKSTTDSAGVYAAPVTVVGVGVGTTTLSGTITLDDGQALTATFTVTVVRAQGSLNVNISGLPLTTSANVDVTQGTTLAGRLAASSTLILLSPGAYTVKASSVTASDGSVYDPTPLTQQATVTTTTANVIYARK